MQNEKVKKVLSYFLLAVYLMLFGYQSSAQSHFDSTSGNHDDHTHDHGDHRGQHHEHHFHIGIFHFFGHLFESFNQVDQGTSDHLAVGNDFQFKKSASSDSLNYKFCKAEEILLEEVDAESLADPPISHLSLLRNIIYSSSPLRAPPSLV